MLPAKSRKSAFRRKLLGISWKGLDLESTRLAFEFLLLKIQITRLRKKQTRTNLVNDKQICFWRRQVADRSLVFGSARQRHCLRMGRKAWKSKSVIFCPSQFWISFECGQTIQKSNSDFNWPAEKPYILRFCNVWA